MSSLLLRHHFLLNSLKKEPAGTFDDPYLIYTVEDFTKFQFSDISYKDKWFRLESDITIERFSTIKTNCYANLDGNGYTVSGANEDSTTFQGGVLGAFYGIIINTNVSIKIYGSNITTFARRLYGKIINCSTKNSTTYGTTRSSFGGGDRSNSTTDTASVVMNYVVIGNTMGKIPSIINTDILYGDINTTRKKNIFVEDNIGIETYYGTATSPEIINSQNTVDTLNNSLSEIESQLSLPSGCLKQWGLNSGVIDFYRL